jgi:hypothetical protein
MKWNRVLAVASMLAVSTLAACGDDDDGGTGPGTNPPDPVTNVGSSITDGFDLTITWDASADATSYQVVLANADGQLTETVTATTVTFDRVSGGTGYTVTVTAASSGGTATPVTINVATPSLNETFYNVASFNNLEADPGFDASAFQFGTQGSPPNFTVAAMPSGYASATVATTGLVASTDGRTLEQTSYAGAIEPGTALADAWYFGWTVWANDGSDSRDHAALPRDTVDADILADRTWSADTVYVLVKPVFVGADCGADGTAAGCVQATLTIEPGTTIIGLSAAEVAPERGAYLVVSRGSQIIADANANEADKTVRPTEANTIVFTSAKAPGSRASGDWGGLILNGQAQTNAGDEATGEGDSGVYGGSDDNDGSGILRGVRIEFAGDDVTPTDQLNGLALQGVGAGTTLSYIQIHYNRDDGIEPFGGAASVDHLVVTGIGDDSVDGTDGYRGFMQYVLGQQNGQDADNGFEISNNGDDEAASPQSTAVIANATMIGAGENVVPAGGIGGPESDNGIQFREGSNYRVYNSIFSGFGEGGFCIRDAQTIVNALNRIDGQTEPTATISAEGLIMWDNQAAGAAENFAACGGGSS